MLKEKKNIKKKKIEKQRTRQNYYIFTERIKKKTVFAVNHIVWIHNDLRILFFLAF